jgi:hypothetical protein
MNLNKILFVAGVIVLAFIIGFFVWWNQDVNITNNSEPLSGSNLSPISGLECEGYNRRPISVMYASDHVARPLSGINKADIVFEMPVTPDGVTRMMAVFQCQYPDEMGSVRSARNAFIDLASSLDAIFAHWGGERSALLRLDSGIIDNVDALKYEGDVFYRRAQILPPHNGFTSMDRILKIAKKLNYSLDNSFEGFSHRNETDPKNIGNLTKTIFINYNPPYDIEWAYDEDDSLYKRKRGGMPEIDGLDENQVTTDVIILMDAKADIVNQDYLEVDISGQGDVRIYQGGIVINGTWKKDKSDIKSKLYFYDRVGKEIEFLPGKIWVEINTRI